MSRIDDLLFYPLATGDQPVCPKCCSPLVLVGFQSERGMPDFSSFRCPDCGRSCRRRPWGTLESPPSKAAGSDFVGFTPWLSFDTPGRNPEHTRGRDGIDSPSLPPGDFVSEAVVVAVMASAQRYREFVAHLASHCAELSEPQVVGVGGASPADQARLRCHEFEMRFVPMPTRLADR